MIWILFALGIMVAFTAMAFRKNSIVYLSLSFTIIYVIEIFLLYAEPNTLYSFFGELAAKYPPDMGIFTGIYLHSINPGHIFFNILIFFLAGMPFEERIGSFRFTLIFLITGITANIIYSAFLVFYGISSYLIGASGAIFGIMGAFIIMYPDDEITMFLGPVLMPRVKVKYAVIAFMAVEFMATLFWVNDNVAHGAHVIGAVTGSLIGYYYLKRGYGRRKIKDDVDYEVLQALATSAVLEEIYEKIKKENDEMIKNVWVKKFFEKICKNVKFEGKYVICDEKRYKIRR